MTIDEADNTKMINVAEQFSRFPGGRYRTDGKFSGERFRDEFLVPALKIYGTVVVDMDGTLGYGSSFLEEAFGGLVRECGFESGELLKVLSIETSSPILRTTVIEYIKDAGKIAQQKA